MGVGCLFLLHHCDSCDAPVDESNLVSQVVEQTLPSTTYSPVTSIVVQEPSIILGVKKIEKTIEPKIIIKEVTEPVESISETIVVLNKPQASLDHLIAKLTPPKVTPKKSCEPTTYTSNKKSGLGLPIPSCNYTRCVNGDFRNYALSGRDPRKRDTSTVIGKFDSAYGELDRFVQANKIICNDEVLVEQLPITLEIGDHNLFIDFAAGDELMTDLADALYANNCARVSDIYKNVLSRVSGLEEADLSWREKRKLKGYFSEVIKHNKTSCNYLTEHAKARQDGKRGGFFYSSSGAGLPVFLRDIHDGGFGLKSPMNAIEANFEAIVSGKMD